MGKKIENDYRIKILSELDKSEINKSLIKNVYNVSQKQLNTLSEKKVSLKKPNTVNEVFKLFLNSGVNSVSFEISNSRSSSELKPSSS